MPAKHILYCVLDWGLGHASRSVPIIAALRAGGLRVSIAADGRAAALLREAFPDVPHLSLPSYRIRYRHHNMWRNIAAQLPRIAWTAWAEQRQVRRWVREQGIDAIVSDNRFGCYHTGLPSVFITHQLHPIVRPAWLGRWARALNHTLVRRFSECWVPDHAGAAALSGQLSRPALPGLPTAYIGWQSRLPPLPSRPRRWAAVAILSGPEPQRSHFEAEILAQAAVWGEALLVAAGLPGGSAPPACPPGVAYHAYLDATELAEAIASAGFVICRSGYSTLMDLAHAGKACLLVPTPGQTEQVYLAERLSAEGRAICQNQGQLDLAAAARQVAALRPAAPVLPDAAPLAAAIEELIRRLR